MYTRHLERSALEWCPSPPHHHHYLLTAPPHHHNIKQCGEARGGKVGGGGGLKQTLESGKFAFAHTNKLLSH